MIKDFHKCFLSLVVMLHSKGSGAGAPLATHSRACLYPNCPARGRVGRCGLGRWGATRHISEFVVAWGAGSPAFGLLGFFLPENESRLTIM